MDPRSIVILSRRQLLAGISGSISVLAGCAESLGVESSGSSGSVRDPETVTVRNPEDETLLADDGDWSRDTPFVTTSDWLDEVTFADGVPESGIEAVEDFVAETNFSDATIYALLGSYESCSRVTVHSVEWDGSSVGYTGCITTPPPDVRCRADARDGRLKLIRIPARLEPAAINSHSASMQGCGNTPEYETIDYNGTESGD